MTRRRAPHRTAGGRRSGGSGEWERDALVWLVGRSDEPILPSDIGETVLARAQECFWEWLGHDAMHRATTEEHARTARAAANLVGHLTEHGQRVYRVRCIEAAPCVMTPLARGPITHVLDRARRAGAAPLVELGVAAGPGRALWDEASDTWVVLPASAGLPDRRHVALRVVGESMLPLLRPGDIVLVDLDGEIHPGAIIVASSADEDGVGARYVVKRIGRVSEETLELTSLNPVYPPVTIPRDRRHLLGPVVLRWRCPLD
jgi:SOS-response transcriptional repressor LexA